MRRFVVGIDPGAKTGLAIWDNSISDWDAVCTVDFHAVMAWAETVPDESKAQYLIVVESAKQLAIYRRKYGEKEAGAAQAQARSIGQNNRECELLIGELKRRGFEVFAYVPRSTWKNKIHKWSQDECRQITGYASKTNEHVRDAMRFAWEHRHLLRAKTIS